MLLKNLHLKNLLSFRDSLIELDNLNILIGINGSGKSNLLEVIDLLRHTPRDILAPVRKGGGIQDWIWKGSTEPHKTAMIDTTVYNPKGPQNLRHKISFEAANQHFKLVDERIENEKPDEGHDHPYLYYHYNQGHPVIKVRRKKLLLQSKGVKSDQSILSQRRDPDHYPEITYLGWVFETIRTYREWGFGHNNLARFPQKVDMPNRYLEPYSSNLGLVLNRLRTRPAAKQQMIDMLQSLNGGFNDFDVQFEGGTVQVFLQEQNMIIPATRLSDGTLRYLCLLAILCDPEPPPLICIEEPELGLHPDILPTIAKLLQQAAERCQLIVTTHSDILVDAFTEQPQAIMVCEKETETGTRIRRLDSQELQEWLKKYRLGELWISGELGGTRW